MMVVLSKAEYLTLSTFLNNTQKGLGIFKLKNKIVNDLHSFDTEVMGGWTLFLIRNI